VPKWQHSRELVSPAYFGPSFWLAALKQRFSSRPIDLGAWQTKSEKPEFASRARAGSGSLVLPPFGHPSRNVVRSD
jgi:hypothetical protein